MRVTRPRLLPLLAVVLPPLVLAAIGVTHPPRLNLGTAEWWTTMHLLLVPLFPLLAVALWVSLRGDRTPLAWASRAFSVVFVAFYTALDAVSGIATGVVLQGLQDEKAAVIDDLFATGQPLGRIGGYAFLAAVIALLGVAWRAGTRGWMFWSAAVALVGSAFAFTLFHIYWPRGVVAMIGFAIGFGLLEFARGRRAVSPAAASR